MSNALDTAGLLPDDPSGQPVSILAPAPSPATADVLISSLQPGESPRELGIDAEHVARLAEADELPPILVHRHTNRVIDGMHRLRVAVLNGQDRIRVEYFDGSEDEAFAQSVKLNVTHGLPLSLSDRKAAAARILAWRPELSDRATARITGLSDKTVAAIRAGSTAEIPKLKQRLGSDGRWRPLDGAQARRRAAEVIARRPDAPLNEVAASAGVSIGTAHSVRKAQRSGRAPVRMGNGSSQDQADDAAPQSEVPRSPGARTTPSRFPPGSDKNAILSRLARDPSLRFTDSGRELLRWLYGHAIDQSDWLAFMSTIPAHCAVSIAKVARQSAEAWGEMAEQLDQAAKRNS